MPDTDAQAPPAEDIAAEPADPQRETTAVLDDDVLVEDVSIDGMCGVY